ncbi:MAG: farnesyl diphosphate synthase [Thermodesulfobacteriota bacterium]
MDLERYLSARVERVNTALGGFLPGEGDYPHTVHKAVRYSLFAGGKRLRPVLVLASAGAVAGKDKGEVREKAALNTACAFECIHTYSLIHDDLPALDDDELRRGRPTCHKVFGEAAAILAGDALLTSAFGIIAASKGVERKSLVRVVGELARAAGSTGMIGGQMVDLESEDKEIEFAELEYIHIHKTGKLILAAVRCGAILGGGTAAKLESLTRYGEAVGLAFQIADDILDVEGTREELGKNTGEDAKKKKATYPALMGLDASRERAGELVARALVAIEGFDEGAEPLRAIARYIVERRK